MAKYSASMLELATVVCDFEFHEIGKSPRSNMKPDTDRRVSLSDAQPVSE